MGWFDSPEYDDLRYQSIGSAPSPQWAQGDPWSGQPTPELSMRDLGVKQRVKDETSWLDYLSPNLRQLATGVKPDDITQLFADILGWVDAPAKGVAGAVPLMAGMAKKKKIPMAITNNWSEASPLAKIKLLIEDLTPYSLDPEPKAQPLLDVLKQARSIEGEPHATLKALGIDNPSLFEKKAASSPYDDFVNWFYNKYGEGRFGNIDDF